MKAHSINPDSGYQSATPGAPDLSAITCDYYWRVNLESGYREHVRRSDGFIVNRIRLTTEQVEKAKQEKPMEPIRSHEQARVEPEKYGELTVVGEPEMIAGRRMVPVRCSCGVEKHVAYHNLTKGIIKSCGHLRGLNSKRKKPTGPEKQKRRYNRKPTEGVVLPAPVIKNTNGSEVQTLNFTQLGEAIDGITKMARLIPIEQVELILEINRRMEVVALPIIDMPQLAPLAKRLIEDRRTAEAFLVFRRQIESAEV